MSQNWVGEGFTFLQGSPRDSADFQTHHACFSFFFFGKSDFFQIGVSGFTVGLSSYGKWMNMVHCYVSTEGAMTFTSLLLFTGGYHDSIFHSYPSLILPIEHGCPFI